jgi:hypothetical protein
MGQLLARGAAFCLSWWSPDYLALDWSRCNSACFMGCGIAGGGSDSPDANSSQVWMAGDILFPVVSREVG